MPGRRKKKVETRGKEAAEQVDRGKKGAWTGTRAEKQKMTMA